MSITIEISNAELNKCLKNINKFSTAKRMEIGKHVKEAAIDIERLAKYKVATYKLKATGQLIKRIKATYDIQKATARVLVNVWWAKFIEYGTKPHDIYAKPGKVLAFFWAKAASIKTRQLMYANRRTGKLSQKKSSENISFFKHVRHPGTPERTFLRWAVNKVRQSYINGLKRILK